MTNDCEDPVIALLNGQIARIQEEMQHVDPVLLPAYTRAAATASAELRQREAHGRKLLKNFTPDERFQLLLERLRELTHERRVAALKFLGELMAEESIL